MPFPQRNSDVLTLSHRRWVKFKPSRLEPAVKRWARLIGRPVLKWTPYDLLTDFNQDRAVRLYLLSSIMSLGRALPQECLYLDSLSDASKGDTPKRFLDLGGVEWSDATARLDAATRAKTGWSTPLHRLDTEGEQSTELGTRFFKLKATARLLRNHHGEAVAFVDIEEPCEETAEETALGIQPFVEHLFRSENVQGSYVRALSAEFVEEWFRSDASQTFRPLSPIAATEELQY